MFEKEAEEYQIRKHHQRLYGHKPVVMKELNATFKDGAETTLRKVIKYFSTLNLDENCGGYFSHLLENEEELQELAKELENV